MSTQQNKLNKKNTIVACLFVLLTTFSCTSLKGLGSTAEVPVYPALNIDEYSVDDSVWTLDWSDEFEDGVFDDNTWDRQVLLNPYNNEFQKYTGDESTAYENDGYMILEAAWDGTTHSKGHYTSARVISNPGGTKGDSGTDGKTIKFGKIAARVQLPYGKGLWPAFWLLGDNISETGGTMAWPSCGELDILETGFKGNTDGFYGHATLGAAIHYDRSVNNKRKQWNYLHDSKVNKSGLYAKEFHVYELEWDETVVIWRVDNKEFFRADIADPEFNEFRENFYMIFNIAVGGDLTDHPDENTVFPQFMYIDWVRHYTKL